MATALKVPLLGFRSTVKGLVLFGFGADTLPIFADADVCVQMQADDTTIAVLSDDTVINVRSDDTVVSLRVMV